MRGCAHWIVLFIIWASLPNKGDGQIRETSRPGSENDHEDPADSERAKNDQKVYLHDPIKTDRDRIQVRFACEGFDLKIQCHHGHSIHIMSAFYGIDRVAACSVEEQLHLAPCGDFFHTGRKARYVCEGKQSCVIEASRDFLELEYYCPMGVKFLEVYYQCKLKEGYCRNGEKELEGCESVCENLKCYEHPAAVCKPNKCNHHVGCFPEFFNGTTGRQMMSCENVVDTSCYPPVIMPLKDLTSHIMTNHSNASLDAGLDSLPPFQMIPVPPPPSDSEQKPPPPSGQLEVNPPEININVPTHEVPAGVVPTESDEQHPEGLTEEVPTETDAQPPAVSQVPPETEEQPELPPENIPSEDEAPTETQPETNEQPPAVQPAVIPPENNEQPTAIPPADIPPENNEQPSAIPPAVIPPETNEQPPAIPPAVIPPETNEQPPAIPPAVIPSENNEQPPAIPPAVIPPETNEQPPAIPPAVIPPENNEQTPAIPPAVIPPENNEQPPAIPPAVIPPETNEQPPAVPPAAIAPENNEQPPAIPPAVIPSETNEQPPAIPPAVIPPETNEQPPAIPPAVIPSENEEQPPAIPPAVIPPETNEQPPAIPPAVLPPETEVEPEPMLNHQKESKEDSGLTETQLGKCGFGFGNGNFYDYGHVKDIDECAQIAVSERVLRDPFINAVVVYPFPEDSESGGDSGLETDELDCYVKSNQTTHNHGSSSSTASARYKNCFLLE